MAYYDIATLKLNCTSIEFAEWLKKTVKPVLGIQLQLPIDGGFLYINGPSQAQLGNLILLTISAIAQSTVWNDSGPSLVFRVQHLSDNQCEVVLRFFTRAIFTTDFPQWLINEMFKQWPDAMRQLAERYFAAEGAEQKKGEVAATELSEESLGENETQDHSMMVDMRQQVLALVAEGFELSEIEQQEVAKRVSYNPRTIRRLQKSLGFGDWHAFRRHLARPHQKQDSTS